VHDREDGRWIARSSSPAVHDIYDIPLKPGARVP